MVEYLGQMIAIIDTYNQIPQLYTDGKFNLEKWKFYMESICKDVADISQEKMKQCIATGLVDYENNYLPVLNAVYDNREKRELLYAAFLQVTDKLNQIVEDRFQKELDADIVLYLGLCTAAGKVIVVDGRTTIFLGIEKMMELDWYHDKSVQGLIYHELGHVYQQQFGVLERTFDKPYQQFLWQLFTEGIAMYFQQILAGDLNFYHQDDNGWAEWCENHLAAIKMDFMADLPIMTFTNQRYFGDWVKYRGHSDVGYYLGCRFVHFIRERYCFNEMIGFEIDMVEDLYQQFIGA